MTTLERILAKVELSPDGCLLWTGANNGHGYGNVGYKDDRGARRTRQPHRLVYEAFVGPVPDGFELDHLCRVRRCVNPAHVEIVTHQENGLRGLRGRLVTRCAQGHQYTPENTIIRSDGRRRCKTCARAHHRRYYLLNRDRLIAADSERRRQKRQAA